MEKNNKLTCRECGDLFEPMFSVDLVQALARGVLKKVYGEKAVTAFDTWWEGQDHESAYLCGACCLRWGEARRKSEGHRVENN